MEIRERNSIGYNPPPSNQESSPAPLITSPPLSTRRIETQTLDHHHHPPNNNHEIHLQQEQAANRPRRDPNPEPDPGQPVGATPAPVVRYRECLKNHAANMGAHVVDGCGEFMPDGEEGTPEALKCAACQCHRSFHRREIEGELQSTNTATNCYYTQNPGINTISISGRRATVHHTRAAPPPQPTMPPPAQQHKYHYHHGTAPMMMAFGGTSGPPAESSNEDLNVFRSDGGAGQQSKKRFRTKFTQEQKDRMQQLAERLGWKIQKQDEQEVVQFCNEVGVKRQVLKVWMHNNKQAMKRKQL